MAAELIVQQSTRTSGTPTRKHSRYRCNQQLSVRYRFHNHEMIAYGRCNVVGKGGIGAHLPTAQLDIGQEVSLEIAIAKATATVALKALVKDRRGVNYGFQFVESQGHVAIMLKPLFQPEALVLSLTPPDASRLISPANHQRRHKRVPASGELTLIMNGGATTVRKAAELIEVSRGGFRISHDQEQLVTGRELTAEFFGVPMACRVAWTRSINGRFESGLAVTAEE